eukprot:scaffold185957_cov30-Tisochrysis_lutea.AAC.3
MERVAPPSSVLSGAETEAKHKWLSRSLCVLNVMKQALHRRLAHGLAAASLLTSIRPTAARCRLNASLADAFISNSSKRTSARVARSSFNASPAVVAF